MKVTVLGRFHDREDYLGGYPYEADYFYEDTLQPLTPEHKEKVEWILSYYVEHDIQPLFLVVNSGEPIEAEKLIDLNLWTNTGLPKYNILDIATGRPFEGLPHAKGGRKSAK